MGAYIIIIVEMSMTYKRKLFYLFFILAFSFTCTSCSNKQYQALFEQKEKAGGSLDQKQPDSLKYYHIQAQDQLEIKNLQDIKYIVTQSPDPSGTSGGGNTQGQIFEVREDGTITLPAVGRITVAGLTRLQATELIEGLYRKNLLKDPIIAIRIVNLKVTVFGETKGQGNFSLTKDRTTLVELIGQAGGLTDRADETNIKIIRGTQQNPTVIKIDLSNITSINDPRAVLQNGDIIYVEQNKRAIRNDKVQNFSSIFQPAVLLFNTILIIFTLVRVK